jgi:DNA-binding transcriptional LysR family regulator
VSRHCFVAALAFWLAACSGPVTIPTATGEPPVQVATTLSAQPITQTITDRTLTGAGPFLITVAGSQPDLLLAVEQGNLIGITLYLPTGSALWATPLYEEPIVIIANPANPIENLTLDQLQDIYAGRDTTWQAAAREDGDDSRLFFETVALRGLRPAATTRLTPSPEAMRKFVNETPNGIGYLPLHWLDDNVRVVSLDGQLPTNESYGLIALAVAVAKSEPSGPARAWLGNVQETYSP